MTQWGIVLGRPNFLARPKGWLARPLGPVGGGLWCVAQESRECSREPELRATASTTIVAASAVPVGAESTMEGSAIHFGLLRGWRSGEVPAAVAVRSRNREQGDGAPAVLRPNWLGLEHQWTKRVTGVVMVELEELCGCVNRGQRGRGARRRQTIGSRCWTRRWGVGLRWRDEAQGGVNLMIAWVVAAN